MNDPRLPVPRAATGAPSRWRKFAILTFGYFFVALGVVGIALPFLHGLLFLLIGLALLSQEVAWAGRLRLWIARRFPRAHDVALEAEFRAGRWMRRLRSRLRRRQTKAGP